MRITIEYDDKVEALCAMQGEDWHDAMFELDQRLRGIIKRGHIGVRELTKAEIDVYIKCREMLQEALNNNELKFNI